MAEPTPAGGEGVAWVFPGQGSQWVGMGRTLAATDADAAAVFATVDAALGFALSAIVFDGPEDALRETANQQPAILAVSVAYHAVLRARGLLPDAALVAGHSLGEYAALVAAGALDLGDAARLVRRRGELMTEHGAGAMAAIIGLPPAAVAEVAAEAGAEVANFNAPDQTVVSGHHDAVATVMALATARGAKRALPLPVSGAFHSSLMAPVAAAMRPLLAATPLRRAHSPLVGNVAARPIAEPDTLREELVGHICAPVRWVDVVSTLTEAGVGTFYEVGPGKVLAGLVARCARGARTITAESLL